MENVIDANEKALIQSIHLSRNPCEDRRIWQDNMDGALTVKLTYSSIRNTHGLTGTCFQLDGCFGMLL